MRNTFSTILRSSPLFTLVLEEWIWSEAFSDHVHQIDRLHVMLGSGLVLKEDLFFLIALKDAIKDIDLRVKADSQLSPMQRELLLLLLQKSVTGVEAYFYG